MRSLTRSTTSPRASVEEIKLQFTLLSRTFWIQCARDDFNWQGYGFTEYLLPSNLLLEGSTLVLSVSARQCTGTWPKREHRCSVFRNCEGTSNWVQMDSVLLTPAHSKAEYISCRFITTGSDTEHYFIGSEAEVGSSKNASCLFVRVWLLAFLSLHCEGLWSSRTSCLLNLVHHLCTHASNGNHFDGPNSSP